ncbi:hypothetical protein JTY60_02125 [symbiont of Argiope bruennichi]|uniref:hypothetical protein n=1 Tax=symbiont of Argiope bruennichi TaxID=2810479 RepID=UPI003DA6945D
MRPLVSFLLFLYQKSKKIWLFCKSFLLFFLIIGFTAIGFVTGILFYKIYNYFYNWNYFVPDSVEKIIYGSKTLVAKETSDFFKNNFQKQLIDIFKFLASNENDEKTEEDYSLEKVLCKSDDCVKKVDDIVGQYSPHVSVFLPVDTTKDLHHHFQLFNDDHFSANYSLNNLFNFIQKLLTVPEAKERAENWYKSFFLKIPSQFDLPVTFTGLINLADQKLNKYFPDPKDPLEATKFSVTDDNGKKIWNDDIFNAIEKQFDDPNFYTTLTYHQNNLDNFDESLFFLVPLPKLIIGFNQKIYSVSNIVIQLFLSKYFKFSADLNFNFSNNIYNINKINYGVLV